MCAVLDLMILKIWSFCLNAPLRSDSLKHKVTVGKDTLNLKKAVCCSEVGQIDKMAKCKRGISS